jgi:hypothetical protein
MGCGNGGLSGHCLQHAFGLCGEGTLLLVLDLKGPTDLPCMIA